ncbi:MAG: hypothetical protein GWN55_05820 [Phycisphaerae bacterium]|nr:hypothetical protein [Phycisphaerae bacterium]
MSDNPLSSLNNYSHFVTELLHRPPVQSSSVVVWSTSPYTGVAEGEVFFANNIRLRMREELDFDAELITSYGYEVYQGRERLYWYDDFPHPNDPSLASTFPHHKHVPPNIKHNRIPAPEMSFTRPNLTLLIQEIENLIKELGNEVRK